MTDGSSSGTIANSKAVIYGSSGEVFATTQHLQKTAASGDVIGWRFQVSNPSSSTNNLSIQRRFNDVAHTAILEITNSGHIVPAANNQQDLGESGTAFRKLHAIDGDFDGTLEADAITVNGATLNSVIADEAVALAIALG